MASFTMSKAANMRVSMKATLSSKRCTGVPSRAMTRVQGRSARLVLRASVGETAEENAARLMRESKAVDERTVVGAILQISPVYCQWAARAFLLVA